MRTLFTDLASSAEALSVAELNRHIAQVLNLDPILSDVAVRGEISNFKQHSSGHIYFSLNDERAQIRCCLWRSNVSSLRFKPGNGDRVIADGKIEYYAPRGETSFIVRALRFDGQGAQHEAFERLKAALSADGLFDESRKKPLPLRPFRIGLISSRTGAAPHDVLSVLARRWPLAEVVLIPALVQGADAPADLIRALSWAEVLGDLETVIVARGGGSSEDLWGFNDEMLCRYAADFPLPLISAVGHETDFTLFDFVADVRAATPTAAAEIAAPHAQELLEQVSGWHHRLKRTLESKVLLSREKLDRLSHHPVLARPHLQIQEKQMQLEQWKSRLYKGTHAHFESSNRKLQSLQNQLRALDPQRVLERGYAILSDDEGKVLISARSPLNQQKFTVRMHDGTFKVRVEDTYDDQY